ncbi:MAG: 2-oxoacid:acceptor oxidoreductase family protein [Nitrososphaerota archaeon]
MKEIIIQGLGGQGPRIAGECLVQASVLEGKYAQARPCFGPERRAGIVAVFFRLDDRPIRRTCLFQEADCILTMHEYLFKHFLSNGSLSVDALKMHQEGTSLLRLDDSVLRGILSFGATGIEMVQLKKGGIIIANSKLKPEEIKFKEGVHPSKVATLDAISISNKIYGERPIPIVNTIMMGAFAKATGWLGLDSVLMSIEYRWPTAAKMNIEAIEIG